ALAAAAGYYYWFTPGLPVRGAKHVDAKQAEAGRALFEHEWVVNDPLAGGDGLGPVVNATSCAACHNPGRLGGGGAAEHNVHAFQVIPHPHDSNFHFGQVHAFAVRPQLRESEAMLEKLFPQVPGGLRDDNGQKFATLNPVTVQSMNSTALFGAGWIDRVS